MSNSSNFVEIIGYSLEKIHSGMLAWLIRYQDNDHPSAPISDHQRNSFIEYLSGGAVDTSDIASVICNLEYPLHKQIRADLFIRINYHKQEPQYLVVEMKTDSDIRIPQLYSIMESALKYRPSYALICLGASQYTRKHINKENPNRGLPEVWKYIDIEEMLSKLVGIDCSEALFEQWIDSLRIRHARFQKFLISDIPVKPTIRADYYALFDAVRCYLYDVEELPFDWRIINGSHNAAMYAGWYVREGEKRGPSTIKEEKRELSGFWWDFNDSGLYLKGQRGQLLPEEWNQRKHRIRYKLEGCFRQSDHKGCVTSNRSGDTQSLYKWPINFGSMNAKAVSAFASQVIRKAGPIIEDVLKNEQVINR